MPKSCPPYPAEFRQQIVELAQAGRTPAELIEQGCRVSGKRIARLMKLANIRGVSRRRGSTVTTRTDQHRRPAPDLVQRTFRADAPNQLWVADMTYVPT